MFDILMEVITGLAYGFLYVGLFIVLNLLVILLLGLVGYGFRFVLYIIDRTL